MAVATHCDGRHTNGENLQARPSTHVETFTPRLGSISTARIDLRDGWTLDAIGPQGRPWMWDDDYDVLENGGVVGRIFKVPVAPPERPWMWTSGHNGDIRRAARGYEPTREAAMAAFRSWCR
jgi:hypothetical protein